MKFIGYRTLKTGIGAALAMTIAINLELKYVASASIISILSIQNTRRQSVRLAAQRAGACILAMFLSSILFRVFGFNALVFGVFLLIFIPLAVRFKLNEGIVMSSVLVTHILSEQSTRPALIFNELSLMLIGIGTALLLNLHMPDMEKAIKEDQVYIEDTMRELLRHMSRALRERAVSIKEEQLLNNLEQRLRLGRDRAYRSFNNSLYSGSSYYVKYMDMRIQQLMILRNMRRHFERFSITYKQTIMIANFTSKLADSLHEKSTAEESLRRLKLLRENFRTMELPKTREEFENRAALFQFFNDLEEFLLIKNEFKKDLKQDVTMDI